MEEKIGDESDLLIKKENEKASEEDSEKGILYLSECSQPKEEKKVLVRLPNCMEDTKNGIITQKTENVIYPKVESLNPKNLGIASIGQHANRQIQMKTKNKVLKRKLTEDGATIERVLSEGEASSGFETVSSIDSKLDIEDISLTSSEHEEEDFNVIVRVENDLVSRKSNFSERSSSCQDRSISPERNIKSGSYTGKYMNQRYDSYRRYKETKYTHSNSKYGRKDYGYSKRDIWSRKNDDYYEPRRKVSRYHEYSRSSDYGRRSWSRCSDQSRKSRESKCSDHSKRSKGSGNRFDHSRSTERKYRSRRSRSPTYKRKNIESRHSRSPEKSKSKFSRNSIFRKRQRSFSKSPPSPTWKRMDDHRNSSSLKKTHVDKSPNKQIFRENTEKERTPFLIELERKLKEIGTEKNIAKEQNLSRNEQTKTSVNINVTTSASGPVACENPMSELSSNYISSTYSVPEMYSLQCTSMPTMSVDNLPLVPGQTGLPVHISATGEMIPHDMDGRRIPIGPSGYYLPLDPTGRLFAHIVSPGNLAVPIHMTEDGVLRLPNSEPVPYGPTHRFPVNIDGSIILMGPDSKPLVPCSNLPSQPPFHLLQMMQYNTFSLWQTVTLPGISTTSQASQIADKGSSQNTAPEVQHFHPSNLQPFAVKNDLLGASHDFADKTNNADLLSKYQKKARERSEDERESKEMKKNLEVSSSKKEVKISALVKPTQKETSKDEFYNDADTILDSNDSDSASGSKASSKTKTVLGDSKSSSVESNSEDFIVKKIRQVLKSLSYSNFKPPTLGRLIISKVAIHPVEETSPNISPLLRNRVILPYITPNSENLEVRTQDEENEITIDDTSSVGFSFLFEGKSTEEEEKPTRFSRAFNKNLAATKFPVFTFDFAMQCDFTTVIIQNLTSKVAEMEMEVVRLRNINANLLDGFRNIHESNKKKTEELGKALLEIEKRNNEILTLKSIISEKGT